MVMYVYKKVREKFFNANGLYALTIPSRIYWSSHSGFDNFRQAQWYHLQKGYIAAGI